MSLIWDINGPYNAASDRLASRFVASDVHLTERRIDYAPYNLWTWKWLGGLRDCRRTGRSTDGLGRVWETFHCCRRGQTYWRVLSTLLLFVCAAV